MVVQNLLKSGFSHGFILLPEEKAIFRLSVFFVLCTRGKVISYFWSFHTTIVNKTVGAQTHVFVFILVLSQVASWRYQTTCRLCGCTPHVTPARFAVVSLIVVINLRRATYDMKGVLNNIFSCYRRL